MIQDINKRWMTNGSILQLAISGSLRGVLSRISHPDGSNEKWILAQGKKNRELLPKEAARIVANEAALPRDINEGEVMDSRSARQDDAVYAEELFNREGSPQEVVYQDGDFMVRITRLPGRCQFGKFSVLLEIAISDFDGYYMVHREETQHWTNWSRALRFLLTLAEELINTHAMRVNGALEPLWDPEDDPVSTVDTDIMIVDRAADHVEVAQ